MLIYVVSPFRANDLHSKEDHVALAHRLCRAIALAGHEPFAAHLFCPQFLSDDDEKEREIGLRVSRTMIAISDEVWIWDLWGISEGMKSDIDFALQRFGSSQMKCASSLGGERTPFWIDIIKEQ